jgi:hypothetical protein
MAKRGTFSSLVKRFPPIGRGHWKRHKLLTILANRRQEERFTDPVFTTAQEILAENGSYILAEHTPYAYIITE